jgi:hypothetical protein
MDLKHGFEVGSGGNLCYGKQQILSGFVQLPIKLFQDLQGLAHQIGFVVALQRHF